MRLEIPRGLPRILRHERAMPKCPATKSRISLVTSSTLRIGVEIVARAFRPRVISGKPCARAFHNGGARGFSRASGRHSRNVSFGQTARGHTRGNGDWPSDWP